MGLFSRATDTFYTFRFLRLLTTPWEKTGAYKAGLISNTGKVIRKPETSDEKSVYNYFHRLVFNIKRMLNNLPLGKTTIASYLAALFLLKEHTGMSDQSLSEALEKIVGYSPDVSYLLESTWFQTEDGRIRSGTYTLNSTIPLPKTGDMLALRNTFVIAEGNLDPVGHIFGVPLYELYHPKTKQNVYVTLNNLSQ